MTSERLCWGYDCIWCWARQDRHGNTNEIDIQGWMHQMVALTELVTCSLNVDDDLTLIL